MEDFLQALERSQDLFAESKGGSHQSSCEKSLSFEIKPPQWCTVDKWFHMSVICHDPAIQEVEAVLYNREGEIKGGLQAEKTNDKEKNRVIVTVHKLENQSRKANFEMRFTEGSQGSWFNVGLHGLNKPEKCLLKSPPVKVQPSRISKRPREMTKKLGTFDIKG
jgi:hypothetical protein